MSQKQASKRRRGKKAVAVLGAAGVLSLAGSASAAIVGPATDTPKEDNPSRHVVTLSEEEIFDVSLATFYVYDKENARTHLSRKRQSLRPGRGAAAAAARAAEAAEAAAAAGAAAAEAAEAAEAAAAAVCRGEAAASASLEHGSYFPFRDRWSGRDPHIY